MYLYFSFSLFVFFPSWWIFYDDERKFHQRTWTYIHIQMKFNNTWNLKSHFNLAIIKQRVYNIKGKNHDDEWVSGVVYKRLENVNFFNIYAFWSWRHVHYAAKSIQSICSLFKFIFYRNELVRGILRLRFTVLRKRWMMENCLRKFFFLFLLTFVASLFNANKHVYVKIRW